MERIGTTSATKLWVLKKWAGFESKESKIQIGSIWAQLSWPDHNSAYRILSSDATCPKYQKTVVFGSIMGNKEQLNPKMYVQANVLGT